MSRYPLEPSYAKAMITSKLIGCHEEMSVIVALLSTENVWTRVTKVDQEGFQRFWLLQEHYADI
jgi:ATP-dependent RNA helicase DHX8/PRP22